MSMAVQSQVQQTVHQIYVGFQPLEAKNLQSHIFMDPVADILLKSESTTNQQTSAKCDRNECNSMKPHQMS